MAGEDVIPREKANERFKELGFSVFMVKATVGLAQVEVCQRAEQLAKVWWESRERGLHDVSELLREVASVTDAVHKLQAAEKKSKEGC